jgi:hypothetical protein
VVDLDSQVRIALRGELFPCMTLNPRVAKGASVVGFYSRHYLQLCYLHNVAFSVYVLHDSDILYRV